MSNGIDADVVVVGAGLAGLSAAWELRRAGVSAIVLEARDRVGGRTWTVPGPDGTFIDHGGQWVGPTQERILALAAEMGVETFPTHGLEGERFVSIGGRDDLTAEVVAGAVAQLETMAAELPRDAPWEGPRAREWDAQTFQTWLLGHVGDPAGRALLRAVVKAVFTSEADELSLLHVLAYMRSAGSLMLLTQVEGAAQERRFVGGAQTVSERVAERLGPEVVRLGAPVRRLVQPEEGGVAVEADGVGTVRARRAIVAVPMPLMDRIAYQPRLPGHRSQLHCRMATGATIKLHCVYPEPFWRATGHTGRGIADDRWVSVIFDNGCPGSERGVLVGFVEADAARRFARLSPAERRAAAIADLVDVFGEQAAEPIAYFEQDWREEEWTRGCFGGNFGPGGWTRYGAALREPFGRVHWAGAECSPIWMNYMDGAVRSGERAAADVVAALGAEAAV